MPQNRPVAQAPIPVVNVWNDIGQDGNSPDDGSSVSRASSRFPTRSEFNHHRRRDREVHDRVFDDMDELDDELRDVKGEMRQLQRMAHPPDIHRDELLRNERQLQAFDRTRQRDRFEEQIRLEAVLKEKARQAEAEEMKKRIIKDYERERREQEEKRKAERKKIKEELEREEREAKEKEEREWKDFLRKQKEKADEEARKKEEAEAKFQEEMSKRLARFDIGTRQIQTMIEKPRDKEREPSTSVALMSLRPGAPIFPKVCREFVAVETLKHFRIPYEVDERDRDYFLLKREMSREETELLFEHTKSLRAKPLLIEPASREPKFAWYRRRGKRIGREAKTGVLSTALA